MTRADILARGYSVKAIASAVRAGSIVRLRRAWYGLPNLAEDVSTAVRLGGKLGAVSAARSYGWWTGLDHDIHVSWPPHGNVSGVGRDAFPGVVRHWREVPAGLLTDSECWREAPEVALAQVLRYAGRELAVACANSAIKTGGLDLFATQAAFVGAPLRVQEWARHVDGMSDSGMEDQVRLWFDDRGIPFLLHPQIEGAGEFDFLVGRSLLVETDGKKYHEGEIPRHRDYVKDNLAATQGYVTARFNYAMVMYDWPGCERRILEHLARRDHLRVIRPR